MGDGVVASDMGAIFSVGVVGAVAKLQPADLAATDDDIGGSDGEGRAEKDCERGDRCKSSSSSLSRNSSASHLRFALQLSLST